MENSDPQQKYPKPVHSKEERVTSLWLEFLKGLTPKQQKKEQFKRKIFNRRMKVRKGG